MLSALKFLGAPGSISFFVIAMAAGVLVVRYSHRFRRAGTAWLLSVTAVYVTLAMPVVAHAIANALPDVAATANATTGPSGKLETLVVLDGDNRRGRAREVQRAIAALSPSTVWVLGGRWILEALEENRVSGPQFRYDATADTTFEQMDQLAQIVHATPHGRTAVVVSRLHAPRVAALAQRRALALTVLASEIDTEPPTGGPLAYFPAYVALRVSRDAIYEHAALRYYRMKGWID